MFVALLFFPGVNISHYTQIFLWGNVSSFHESGEEFGHFEAELKFYLYKSLSHA